MGSNNWAPADAPLINASLIYNISHKAKPGTYKPNHDSIHFAAHVLAVVEVDAPAHTRESHTTSKQSFKKR